MDHASHHSIPVWTWAGPLAAALFLAAWLFGLGGGAGDAGLVAAGLLLGVAVFASIHHAEVLAVRLGEPFGSILLAVSVTVIEVALIVSILLSGVEGSQAVARDTVFAALLIVLNGVVGLCLVVGGKRHHEQNFHRQGAVSALGVLGTIATLALVLPNYTVSAPGPLYSSAQLAIIAAATLALYVVFVFVQSVRHRDYFLYGEDESAKGGGVEAVPNSVAWASVVLLLLSLTAVVLLAKILSKPLDAVIVAAGLPKSFVGVVIAGVVLLPEGIAAVKAALANRVQSSVNLALGSAIASIGLTIPVVAAVSLLFDIPLVLGLAPEDMTLLLLTLFVSSLTLGTGRTTILQGAIHLVIFVAFLLIAAAP